MTNGNTVTPASRASVEGFRQTLPPAGSELRICAPDCTECGDAGKRAGQDHWQPRER